MLFFSTNKQIPFYFLNRRCHQSSRMPPEKAKNFAEGFQPFQNSNFRFLSSPLPHTLVFTGNKYLSWRSSNVAEYFLFFLKKELNPFWLFSSSTSSWLVWPRPSRTSSLHVPSFDFTYRFVLFSTPPHCQFYGFTFICSFLLSIGFFIFSSVVLTCTLLYILLTK